MKLLFPLQNMEQFFLTPVFILKEPPVAQDKRWPADQAVPGSRPAVGKKFFDRKRGFIAQSFII